MFVCVCVYIYIVNSEKCVGLRPLACCDRGFESHPGHGCLSLVIVVCCQSSLRRTDHSSRGVLPTVLRLTGCDLETAVRRRHRVAGAVEPLGGNYVVCMV